MIESDQNSNEELKAMLTKGPVSIGMLTSPFLARYSKGVITGKYSFCSNKNSEVNHGVLMVGYGKVDPVHDKMSSNGQCQ
jgi:hypothetical protein